MEWYVSYGLDEDNDRHPSDTLVKDVYLWAKNKGLIKRVPRKQKKGMYYSLNLSCKYHNKIKNFVINYFYKYCQR